MKSTLVVLTMLAVTIANAHGDRISKSRVRNGNDVRTVRKIEGRDGGVARAYTHRETGRWHRSADGAVRMPDGRTASFETDRYVNPLTGNVRRTWSVEGPGGKTRSGRYRR